MSTYQMCNKCVCDTSNNDIKFDKNGVCSHCHMHAAFEKRYLIGLEGKKQLTSIIHRIQRHAAGKKYGCLVGVSGGMDSIYALYLAKHYGLKPLAMHFDNGWMNPKAVENIHKAVEILNVDLHIVKHDHHKMMQAYTSFFRASVCDLCVPCNLGVSSAMSHISRKFGIRFIVAGGSFQTEGVYPVSQSYWDGMYYKSIMSQHGECEFKDLNKLSLVQSFILTVIRRVTIIQLPFYLEYNIKKIQTLLKNELDWHDGGRHHFDCLYKPFVSYVQQKKFHFNLERICYAAQVRSGQMNREEAIKRLDIEPVVDESVKYCMSQMGMTERTFRDILRKDIKTFKDYKTYYGFLQRIKLPLKILVALRLLPEQTYEKYFES